MANASKGSFLGKLILVIILLIIGIGIGMTPVGWQAQKLYHLIRYRNAPIAKGFVTKPFSLKMAYVQDSEGLKTYLFNEATNDMLPVFEVEGTVQVGEVEYRLKGMGEETRSKVLNLLEEAKKGSSTALDKAKQLLQGLGK
jgi:hypothetical protein